VTLGEFAQVCRGRPELDGLWQKLVDEAHRLVSSKIGFVFFGSENAVEAPFLEAKNKLEEAAMKIGVEYPDLSFKEFKNWILRY